MRTLKLKINGEAIWLDEDDYGLRPNENSYSEQCDGCGLDICETGTVSGSRVVCVCGKAHPFSIVQESELMDGS